MTLPNDTKNNVNDSETSEPIDTGLTQDRSLDVLAMRASLIAMRVAVGADTPDGRTCSNLVEQLTNYADASPPQQARLRKLIDEQLSRLSRQRE